MINKKQIKILNKKYRQVNKETDILTFENKHDKTNLGDLFLCKQVIKNDYMQRTLIHGILHLLGYDHSRKLDAKIMNMLERKIGMSGIEPPTITTSK